MSFITPFLLTAGLVLAVVIYRGLVGPKLPSSLWLIALAFAYPIWTL